MSVRHGNCCFSEGWLAPGMSGGVTRRPYNVKLPMARPWEQGPAVYTDGDGVQTEVDNRRSIRN